MQRDESPVSRLDQAFASFLTEQSALPKDRQAEFNELVCRLSYQQNQGHSCIRLNQNQQDLVMASGMCATDRPSPLVLEHDRLYLHRYWHYETRLAEVLDAQAKHHYPLSIKDNKALLDSYFPQQDTQTDWQRLAAELCLKQQLCIITGGPGTGKTTTVVKILALLQTLSETPLHIALATPTGKAANRLEEAIGSNLQKLPVDNALKALVPEQVNTVHRLLGVKPASPYFYHNQHNPLPYDVIVIDEASMVDLALMSKLADALKPNTRLILLGDKDQLASVESGAVLADLTAALPQNTLQLQKSFRFNQAIKDLANAINTQQADEAWQLLHSGSESVTLFRENLSHYAAKACERYLQLIKTGAPIPEIFNVFNLFQVLSATRQGPNSVAEINTQIETRLAENGQIHLTGPWYIGRPIMITQNDPVKKLYNGDIGLCMKESLDSDQLMVFFERPDGTVKSYLPARLPHCETVYAMTIHKSQGSEFEEVLIALPEQINPVMTRELLYTAITRAKNKVHILTSETIFKQTIKQQVTREGGLAIKLAAFMQTSTT